ncbi:uncharacterized protein LOC117307125 isoform X2 [Asterias rubens]|uniref:uncharacterized protein LOC117307125 isoform X2 n=1 Tax=Asterias rubens TaxID=7604 RepID=UPI001455C699|nr:uncharacterized protein LOC117307125 isoform X2 [Asterias rubens]
MTYYHSFENVAMVLLTHLVTSSYVLQAFLFFGSSVKCNSNEIQMVNPTRDCRAEFDECRSEGRSAGVVCGTDGQNYHSACHLFYQTCISGKNNQVGYIGDCQYQYADKEGAVRKTKTDSDDDDQSELDTTSSATSSSEETTDGGQAGNRPTGQPGEDDEEDEETTEDESDEDMTTPKPTPPTSLPSMPAPMYCVDKSGPQSCKCGLQRLVRELPEFPKCPQNTKCSLRTNWETDAIPPRIPGTDGPPVESRLPMGARVAVAFSSIALASMLAVVAFRLYSSGNITRNRQASDESRDQIEMTPKISGRSGSVQTYTSVLA